MAQSEKRRSARRYRYYEILEVGKKATQTEVKQAFRRLAKITHPDTNPDDPEADEKFKKINEAHEVLSNPELRESYDNSPAECPNCWTHKVVETLPNHWRCTRCWCQFSSKAEITETVAVHAKTKVYVRWSPRIEVFKKTQCSWCRLFFTQPFRCPYRKLHSSCFFFERLGDQERNELLNDDGWWGRIFDLLYWVETKGVMKWCGICGAANPNPLKPTCWNCLKPIYFICPKDNWLLDYDPTSKLWKCTNPAHKAKFVYVPKKAAESEERIVSERCRECGHQLYFDALLKLWRCHNPGCRRIYTYQDLHESQAQTLKGAKSKEPVYSEPHKPSSGKAKDRKPKHQQENQIYPEPFPTPIKKSRKIRISLITLVTVIIIAGFIGLFIPIITVPMKITETYYETDIRYEPYVTTEKSQILTQHQAIVYSNEWYLPSEMCVFIIPNNPDNSIQYVIGDSAFLAGLRTWQRLLTGIQTIESEPNSRNHRISVDIHSGELLAAIKPIQLYANVRVEISSADVSERIGDEQLEYYLNNLPHDCNTLMIYLNRTPAGDSVSMSVNYEWDTIQTGTQEVTKYHEVPAQVEKQRTVTEYEKISMLEWLSRRR